MNPHYPLVSARAFHACEYCRAPEAIFNMRFEVEHITPEARGGDSSEENLALACRSCNLYKSARVTSLDEQTRKEVGLFNPRRDVWREHFSLIPETGEVEGLTARGRATVTRLRMNNDLQVEARRSWIRLGLMGQS